MNTQKIQEYFLFAFLFLLPFQTMYFLREAFVSGEKWQYGTIAVYLSDLLLISVSVFLFVRRFVLRKHPIPNTQYQMSTRILILLILWSFSSILWAGDRWLALASSITLLLSASLFFLAHSITRENIRKVIFVLLLSGVIQSGVGIAQFLYQKSIDSSILGMNSHLVYQAGSSVLKIDSGRFLRAYGTFSHPNILGLYLGVILILCVAYYVFLSTFEKTWSKARERIFLLASMVILFLGLLLSFSRSAWLGVLLGIIAVGAGAFLQKEQGIRMRFLKILFTLILSSLVFGNILSEQIFPRFDTATIEREGSVTERVQSLRDANIIIGEGNILLGTGIGNFTAEMIYLQPERPVWNIQPAHNVFVLVFAELGIVGFVLFLFFLFSLIKNFIVGLDLRLQRASKSLDSRLLGNDTNENLIIKKENILFGVALLVLIPSLFLDHFLWSSHFGLFFFFLLLGLVSRK